MIIYYTVEGVIITGLANLGLEYGDVVVRGVGVTLEVVIIPGLVNLGIECDGDVVRGVGAIYFDPALDHRYSYWISSVIMMWW